MFFSTTPVTRIKFIALALLALILSACGGGGGGSSSSAPSGGGSSGGGGTKAIVSPMSCGKETTTGSGNVTPIVIDGFPCAVAGTAGAANSPQQPFISVKICAPGSTTNCQIIDHIILDTGSTGLRIASSALSSTLQPGPGLPLLPGMSPSTTMTECEQYVASYVYGPMVTVDVYIADRFVKNTPIQVFGVSNYGVPSNCSAAQSGGSNTETDTVSAFGGNGLIGTNFATTDYGLYYDCSGTAASTCSSNQYVGMPGIINQFASDNNGVTITLPALTTPGYSNTPVSGTLTFGVSTQANNTPPANTLALVNDGSPNDLSTTFGTFAVQAGGNWYNGYIDSGTGVTFFSDSANTNLAACAGSSNYSGWYCPTSAQSIPLNFANYGTQATLGTFTISVVNPNYLTNATIAYNNVAGVISSTNSLNSEIALGLSTFFGHTNYFLFAGQTAPGTNLGGSANTTVTGPINGIFTPP